MGHGTNSQGQTFGGLMGKTFSGMGDIFSRMGGQPQANPMVDAPPVAQTNDPVLADYFTRHGVPNAGRPQPQRRMR